MSQKIFFSSFLFFVFIILFDVPLIFAQAPNISYATPFTFTLNTPITPVMPVNTGGAIPQFTYQQVTTIAGTVGIAGFKDGAGNKATFNGPKGIAIDKLGNIFVADSGNNVIRKIIADGTVSTFAGQLNGTSGSIDGTGINASFNKPIGLAFDASGNLFVADKGNNIIRKITPGGVVSTYAGTGIAGAFNSSTALTSTFNQPVAIAIDASGNIYVADLGNNLIRRINAIGGSVVTFAGTAGVAGHTNATVGTSASFNQPRGLVVEASTSNVYVADAGNNEIRKITSTGSVSTLSGTLVAGSADGGGGIATFYAPSSLTSDLAGNVYVADCLSNKIRLINTLNSGNTSTFAGSGFAGSTDNIGTTAEFNLPYGIAMDATGNMVVADLNNHLIRKVSATGYTVSPSLPVGLNIDPKTGIISGTPSKKQGVLHNTINGYNIAGNSSQIIAISVISSSNASLGNLTTSSGGLSPTFSSSNTSYTITLPNDSTTLSITPFASDINAIITVNGTIVQSGTRSQKFPIVVGNTNIKILVTAQDGVTTGTYYIVAKREPSSIATLNNLSINGAASNPTIVPNTLKYVVNLSNNAINAITITPTATQANASISVNGQTVLTGSASGLLPVDAGSNVFTVLVTAQDGITKNTYNVTINRLPTLDKLIVSNGVLAPIFSPIINTYVDSVSNITTSINVTPSFSGAVDTAVVNGVGLISGAKSVAIPLAVGNSVIPIKLTSKDGNTTNTYQLTIVRPPSAIANLSNLIINNGLLTPNFSSNTINYSVIVPYEINSIAITPTLIDPTAKILVNNNIVNSGAQSNAISLALGPNTIVIKVTAQDNINVVNYTISVIRDRGKQTFTFNALPVKSFGDNDFSPGATINSGLPISYSSNNTSVATITKDNKIHIVGIGTATIYAKVEENNNYYPIDSVSQILQVNKGNQIINNTEIPVIIKGSSYDLSSINASSGLSVKFSISNTNIAIIQSNKIVPLLIGKTNLIVSQEGDNYYNEVSKTIEITVEDASNDEIIVHQFITPNGDNVNDFLLIEGLENFSNNEVKIINRNGVTVFNSKGYDNEKVKFDGHSNNNSNYLPAGTYFYIINYTTVSGERKQKTDFLILKY